MSRTTPQGTKHIVARFRTPPEIISDVKTFDNQSVIDNLYKSVDVFEANRSGWEFDYVISLWLAMLSIILWGWYLLPLSRISAGQGCS